MSIWTLDITDRHGPRSLIGLAADPPAGMTAALRRIAAINASAGFEHPRYAVTVDDAPPSVICTGIDDAGLPDHRGIAEILNRIHANIVEPF